NYGGVARMSSNPQVCATSTTPQWIACAVIKFKQAPLAQLTKRMASGEARETGHSAPSNTSGPCAGGPTQTNPETHPQYPLTRRRLLWLECAVTLRPWEVHAQWA